MPTRQGHNKAESGVSLRKKVGYLTLKKEELDGVGLVKFDR